MSESDKKPVVENDENVPMNENENAEQTDESEEDVESSEDDEDDEDYDDSDQNDLRNCGRGYDANFWANIQKLLNVRKKFDFDDEEERVKYYRAFCGVINGWQGQLPNFEIFRTEEVDYILAEYLRNTEVRCKISLIDFVFMSGYKDQGQYPDDGADELVVRRTTAIHQAARGDHSPEMLVKLFRIYNLYEANLTDETGLTHFHVACLYGCEDVVETFFIFNQDPNCIWPETGDSPLHLALSRDRKEVAEELVSHGADPTIANLKGMTPLHVICEESNDDRWAEKFFKMCEKRKKVLQVDAKDNLDRTPLQLAVANFLPNTVEVLLDRGADLSSFVFPTESYFGERFVARNRENNQLEFKLKLAAGAMAVAERLEKRGYKLNRSDALLIMKLFAKHELFKTSANWEIEVDDTEAFATETKKFTINSSLSLFAAMQLRPVELAKKLAYKDYIEFARSRQLWYVPRTYREMCAAHLCEAMSRGFFRRWVLDAFRQLTRFKLPILCCEKIIEKLMNRDLWNVCLAVNE